jgi:hypothetical protein
MLNLQPARERDLGHVLILTELIERAMFTETSREMGLADCLQCNRAGGNKPARVVSGLMCPTPVLHI